MVISEMTKDLRQKIAKVEKDTKEIDRQLDKLTKEAMEGINEF